jgi:eukaryotic-like serine/threonine-protein kinase
MKVTSQRWQQINELFTSALARDASERQEFLTATCERDEELREEVNSLLAAHAEAGEFIQASALSGAIELLEEDEGESIVGQQIGAYEIIREISRGGMGDVYLAQDTRLGRRIVLKLLPKHFTADKDRSRRFKLEARAASALSHANICVIHEVGETADGRHYIVMEYIEGETLGQRMASAQMEVGEVLDVAIQIARALAAAHSAGVVHRDIKPENIMVRLDGDIKVLDFGLAKLTERHPVDLETTAKARVQTKIGMVMGTATYMSPEQARGLAVDERTDIWSLGVVLYEMVTGRAPFVGATSSDVMVSVLEREPLPLLTYAPELPSEMQGIITKALCKDRGERYQAATDLLLDLKNLRQEQEFGTKSDPAQPKSSATIQRNNELARPAQSNVESWTTQIRRHKLGAILVLAMIAAAAAGLAYAYTFGGHKAALDSIAILPFLNVSADPNTEYLSDGMTESIINTLSQIPGVRVTARGTVFRYKGQEVDPQKVGHELGVDAVLTGRVLQRTDALSIQVDLVSTADGSQLWGEHYDRKLNDIFVVQEEIAKQISGKLRTRLTGEAQRRLENHSTENAEAYQLYLKGQYFWNKFTPEGEKTALEYFNQAIAKDPGYALAYVGLADSYGVIGLNSWSPPNEAFPKAKAAATKALEFEDKLAEAHAALGADEMFYDWNWSASEQELRRALELNPNSPNAHRLYAHLLTATGRFNESIAQVKINQQLDPLSLVTYADVVRAYYFARHYDEAIEMNKKAREMDPGFGIAHLVAGAAYEQKWKYEEAITEFQKANSIPGGSSEALGALGHVYAISGKKDEALKVLEVLKEISQHKYVSPLDRAIIYAGLNDKNQALEQLEKAAEDRCGWLINLKVEPRFDNLRLEPRYLKLVQRIGLTL